MKKEVRKESEVKIIHLEKEQIENHIALFPFLLQMMASRQHLYQEQQQWMARYRIYFWAILLTWFVSTAVVVTVVRKRATKQVSVLRKARLIIFLRVVSFLWFIYYFICAATLVLSICSSAPAGCFSDFGQETKHGLIKINELIKFNYKLIIIIMIIIINNKKEMNEKLNVFEQQSYPDIRDLLIFFFLTPS